MNHERGAQLPGDEGGDLVPREDRAALVLVKGRDPEGHRDQTAGQEAAQGIEGGGLEPAGPEDRVGGELEGEGRHSPVDECARDDEIELVLEALGPGHGEAIGVGAQALVDPGGAHDEVAVRACPVDDDEGTIRGPGAPGPGDLGCDPVELVPVDPGDFALLAGDEAPTDLEDSEVHRKL